MKSYLIGGLCLAMLGGCNASNEDELRSEMREAREAEDDLREAKIEQREAALEAAEEKQDEVDAARRKVEREQEDVEKELNERPPDPVIE